MEPSNHPPTMVDGAQALITQLNRHKKSRTAYPFQQDEITEAVRRDAKNSAKKSKRQSSHQAHPTRTQTWRHMLTAKYTGMSDAQGSAIAYGAYVPREGGYAILISKQSSIQNRIMIIDNNPVWIQFEDDMLFVHKVKRVLDIISSVYSTKTSYINTFNLIGNTFGDDINNIQFVILSTFTEEQSQNTILYDTIMDSISSYTNSVPHISFWNLSKYENTILPCLTQQNKAKLLSGYSPDLISQLYNPKQYYIYTPYTNIQYELNSYQYDILDEYINYLVCM